MKYQNVNFTFLTNI